MIEKYLISQPLVMVGVFVAFVAASLLYEIVSFLRTKPEKVAAPAVAETKPASRRKGKT